MRKKYEKELNQAFRENRTLTTIIISKQRGRLLVFGELCYAFCIVIKCCILTKLNSILSE